MEIKIRTTAEIQADRVTIEVDGARLYTAAQVGDAQASEAELVAAPLRRRIAELETEVAVAVSERSEMNARRVAAWNRAEELERRLEKGHVCTEACQPNAHVAFLGRERVSELERELAAERHRRAADLEVVENQRGQAMEEASEARRRVIELTRELEAERTRADENRAWAERAEGRLAGFSVDRAGVRRELEDARAAIQLLSGQLGRISGAVHGPPIHRALRTTWERADARAMAEAIRQVRDALGSPGSSVALPRTGDEATSQA